MSRYMIYDTLITTMGFETFVAQLLGHQFIKKSFDPMAVILRCLKNGCRMGEKRVTIKTTIFLSGLRDSRVS
jgi:hypothetical protein